MKYTFTDRLSDFEFHDAELSFISFENDNLAVEVIYLNIHKNALGCEFDTDMEIERAVMTFEDFRVIDFERWRPITQPRIIFEGAEAEAEFICELKKTFDISLIKEKRENGICFIEIDTCTMGDFSVNVSCKSVRIEWDDFGEKAWYVK